jgi:hypothetical protein
VLGGSSISVLQSRGDLGTSASVVIALQKLHSVVNVNYRFVVWSEVEEWDLLL